MANLDRARSSAIRTEGAQLVRLSDEELIEALASGCADALSVLFDRYHRLILSLTLKLLRNRSEAEDMMQEVFLAVFREATSFNRARGMARTWILQVAYRRSIDRLRYLNSRMFYDLEELSPGLTNKAYESHSLSRLSQGDCTRLIQQTLEQLDDNQRCVIELAHFRGLLLREISEQIGETLPSIRHRYYRGLRKLRQLIAPQKSREIAVGAPRAGELNVHR